MTKMIPGLQDAHSLGLKPYPKKKNSGVDWLGDVPAHWEVRQLGRFGRFFKGVGGTKEDEREDGIPCVRYGDLYTNHQFFISKTRTCVTSDLAETVYTTIQYGDVLFAGSGETLDEIGKSAVNLIRGPACCGGDVIVFRPNINVDARFLGYATDCLAAARQKACIGRGVTVMHIYSRGLKYMAVAIPPLSEQATIVCVLDHVGRRIRRYIQAKETLITLLEEQKQAIIHQAVTGQFDVQTGQSYPAYRASGVDWLGEVPAHWEVRRLRSVSELFVSNVDKHMKEGETLVRLCNYVDVYKNCFIHSDIAFMAATATPEEIERFRLQSGDVLITKDSEAWDDIGVPALVQEVDEDLVSGYHLALIRSDAGRINSEFLYRALQSPGIAYQFHVGATGVTRYGLSHDAIKSIRLPVPPLSEQASITHFLGRRIANINAAIDSGRREIEFMREWRTRLIADVVTGKLDVCETADDDLCTGDAVTGVKFSITDTTKEVVL